MVNFMARTKSASASTVCRGLEGGSLLLVTASSLSHHWVTSGAFTSRCSRSSRPRYIPSNSDRYDDTALMLDKIMHADACAYPSPLISHAAAATWSFRWTDPSQPTVTLWSGARGRVSWTMCPGRTFCCVVLGAVLFRRCVQRRSSTRVTEMGDVSKGTSETSPSYE